MDKTVILLKIFYFEFKLFDYPNSFILSVTKTNLFGDILQLPTLLFGAIELYFVQQITKKIVNDLKTEPA